MNTQTDTVLDITARLRAAAPAKLTCGAQVVVGQRVREDREGRAGIVTEISGGAFGSYCTVVYGDGASTRLPAAMLTGGPGVFTGLVAVAHPDEVALFVGLAAARKSADKRKAERAAADLVAECEALKLKHPELEVGSRREEAAKNMRKLLRMFFPGVKFSVTQPRGSMVYSIDVSWTGGPEQGDVQSICGRFISSSFDGQTDSYESCRTAWTDTFGGCNGVFYRRT